MLFVIAVQIVVESILIGFMGVKIFKLHQETIANRKFLSERINKKIDEMSSEYFEVIEDIGDKINKVGNREKDISKYLKYLGEHFKDIYNKNSKNSP